MPFLFFFARSGPLFFFSSLDSGGLSGVMDAVWWELGS